MQNEPLEDDYPTNTRRWALVDVMLVHRLQRWPNIRPAMVQRLVFAENLNLYQLYRIHMAFV